MRTYPFTVMRFAPILGRTGGPLIVRAVSWHPTLAAALEAARSTTFYRGRTWVSLRGAPAHSTTKATAANAAWLRGRPTHG